MFSGAPVTVYVVVPVERLEILSKLLRIWIGTLLHSAFKSRTRLSCPVLFLLDHGAEFGTD
jgi:type IV secretory pathway TraG/TraD family ATPase VirD4